MKNLFTLAALSFLSCNLFAEFVIDGDPGQYGSPVPAYGTHTEMPQEATCGNVVTEESKINCVGWELKDAEGNVIRTSAELAQGESATKIIFTESDTGAAQLTWKFENEYYIRTVAEGNGELYEDKSGWYREGDTVEVSINESFRSNFKGWGGFTSSDSHEYLEPLLHTVKEPTTLYAYFTTSDRDELILNGDFEMNNDSSNYYSGILPNLDRLSAGTWTDLVSFKLSQTCSGGILAAQTYHHSRTQLYAYEKEGLSAVVMAETKTGGNDGSISCYVSVPCPGDYAFSFVYASGMRGDQYFKNSSWTVSFDLEQVSDNPKTVKILDLPQVTPSVANDWQSMECEIKIPAMGLYKLTVSIKNASIEQNDPNAGNQGKYVATAFDNVSLKLRRKYGFSLKIR
mgnify:CR=1 FL=1